MTRPGYRARRLRARDGRLIGWGVFLQRPAGRASLMASGYTGPLVAWRAMFRAASLNLRDWR